MKAVQKEKLQQFRRAHSLLTTGEVDPRITAPLSKLGEALTRLDALGTVERAVERSARAQTIRLRALARVLLVEHLRRIAIAAAVAYPSESSELAALRALVRQPTVKDYVVLILTARGVAKSIEPDVDRFIATGLAKDFHTQLLAAAAALERAVQVRAELAQQRRAATEGVREQVKRGSLHLRLLHSFVRPALEGDPEARARWEQATRLTKSGASKPAEGDGGGEGTSTSPASSAGEVKAAA